jgi:hypothetical protein
MDRKIDMNQTEAGPEGMDRTDSPGITMAANPARREGIAAADGLGRPRASRPGMGRDARSREREVDLEAVEPALRLDEAGPRLVILGYLHAVLQLRAERGQVVPDLLDAAEVVECGHENDAAIETLLGGTGDRQFH